MYEKTQCTVGSAAISSSALLSLGTMEHGNGRARLGDKWRWVGYLSKIADEKGVL